MDIHHEIQQTLDNLEKQRLRTLELAASFQDCIDASEAFTDSLTGMYTTLSIGPYDKGAVYLQVVDVKTLRSILPLIRFLRKRGHKVSAPLKDYAESNQRDYFLGDIVVRIFLSAGDKKACRYVVTGHREVPIYELRCEDDAVAQPETTTASAQGET